MGWPQCGQRHRQGVWLKLWGTEAGMTWTRGQMCRFWVARALGGVGSEEALMMRDLTDGRRGSEIMGAPAVPRLLPFTLARPFQKGISPGSLSVEPRVPFF